MVVASSRAASRTEVRPRWRRCALRWGACAAVLAAVSGCVPSRMEAELFLRSEEHLASGAEYRLLPGDAISIHSPHVLELDGVSQRVGQNGKVDLDLVGEMHIAGLTTKEVRRKLETQLQPYYADPQIRVRIAEATSKKIYVFGQVSRGGARPYTGRDTVMDVIMDAGPLFTAWTAQIKVLRPSATEGERHEIKVNFDRMVEQGDLSLNFLLQEGDIVWVPATVLGWIGLRLQEIFFPLQPLIQAYQVPASVIQTNDVYQDDDDDDDGNNRRLYLPSARRF